MACRSYLSSIVPPVALLHKQPGQALGREGCSAGDRWFRDNQYIGLSNTLCACSICVRYRPKRRIDQEQEYLTIEPCPAWSWGHCSRCSGKLCFSPDHAIGLAREPAPLINTDNLLITEQNCEPKPSSPHDDTIEQMVLSSTKVLFGSGASIQRVMLRSQPLHVVLCDLPVTTSERELYFAFAKPGFQNFRVHRLAVSHDGFHKTADVVFDKPMAKDAVDFLGGVELRGKRLKLQLSKGSNHMLDISPVFPNLLHISWMTPHAAVTVAYDSVAKAQAMARDLENTVLDGRQLRARLKRFQSKFLKISYPLTIVRLSGLPVDVTKDFIRNLAGCSYVSPIGRRKYDLERAFSRLRKDVDKAALVQPKDYKRDESELASGFAAVQVSFRTWEQARRVRDGLANRRISYIGGKKLELSLKEPFRFSITIPFQQYKVRERTFLSISSRCRQDPLARMQISSTDFTSCIEVFGSSKRAVGALKVQVEHLLAGERICAWDSFFESEEGVSFVETISNTTGIILRAEAETSSFRAFGEASGVSEARASLMRKVDELAGLSMQLNPMSVKFFETEGLDILKELVGGHSVTFNLTSLPPTISIRGGPDAQHILRGLVESIACTSVDFSSSRTQCPICFDVITNPVRLECGHEYCYSCVYHFLTTATDVGRFPLCCTACDTPLSIPLLRRFLTPIRFTQLLEASFQSYVYNNPDKYRHCPTPSCPQLYQVHKSEKYTESFECPSCFLSLCPACHRAPHQSITCEEWCRNCDPQLQDKLLEQWVQKRKDDVKRCPKCDALIEKNSGCSHMRCRCGIHICWRCMQTWSSATEVYTHLKTFHNAS